MQFLDALVRPRSRAGRFPMRPSSADSPRLRGDRSRRWPAFAAERLERRDLLAVDVVRTSENLRFVIDLEQGKEVYGEYQTYKVTNNTAAPLTNVWVRATDFRTPDPLTPSKVNLGAGEDGLYFLGNLAVGESKTAFLYYTATEYSLTETDPQIYTIEVWDQKPPAPPYPPPAPLTSQDFAYEYVVQALATKDGTDKMAVSYIGPSSLVVGDTFTIEVTGRVKPNPQRILFSPATALDWPADAFEMRAAQVNLATSGPLAPDMIFDGALPGVEQDFTASYTFVVTAPTSGPTRAFPTQYTLDQSGTTKKFKHDDADPVDFPFIPPAQFDTALEITKSGTTTAVAGSATIASYTITVSSTGANAATGVTVTDTWPAQFTKLPITPPAGTTITGETTTGFIWNIGNLAAGTSKSLTVSFRVPATTAPGDYTNTAVVGSTTPNPNPDTATATTTVVNVPLTIEKAPATTTVVAGTIATQTYTITVINTSAYAAEGVTVADVWPAALNRLPITPPLGTTITGATTTGFTWNISTLAAGATIKLTVNYTVPKATAAGTYTNTATLSSATANPNPKVTTASTTVVTADLSIAKAPSVTVPAGTSAVQTFTITVTNTSAYAAEGVTVTDAWPSVFPKQPITPPLGTTISGETASGFTWNIGPLAAGATLTLNVFYTVPKATTVGAYTNTATLASTTADPGPTVATATTTVVAVDLAITKVGDSATVRAGTSGHWYRITVTNTSSAFAAENVVVTDTWPAEFPKEPITPPAGTTITGETATGFTWNIGTLAPLTTVQLQVDFSVPAATPLKLYTNIAVVSSTTQDPGEKTAIATTLVEPSTSPALVVSSDDGCNLAFVQLMTADGATVGPVLKPYGNVCGGVRAAAGDINGDGIDELVVAPGRGIAGPVKVYPLGSTTPSYAFYPYGTAYRGGIELACADVNNDGRKDIITGMSLGIGTVNVYTVNGVASLYRTFRGAPAGYAGGVRIAAADFGTYENGVLVSPNLDGKAEVVVGPNAGTLARVGIYDLSPATPKLARTIIPFGPGYTGGVTLSTGNYGLDPTHTPDIFVGAGIRRQSVVSVFNAQSGAQIGPVLTYYSSFARPNAAVNVQPLDVDGDGSIDNLYGVQGLSGGGGTRGVRRVQLGVTPTITTLQNYLPPLRIKAVNLVGFAGLASLRGAQPR